MRRWPIVVLLGVLVGCPPPPPKAPSVVGIPWLDDFDPPVEAPLIEIPRELDGSFMFVAGGAYYYMARAYCLDPNVSGPGGDVPYVAAPFTGPFATLLQTVVQGASIHPQAAQEDVQLLLWAIVSCESVDSLNDTTKVVAQTLLTPAQIAQINTNASKCPVPASSATVAQAIRTRNVSVVMPTTTAKPQRSARVKAATTTGDPYPVGRWVYTDGGVFLRYLPLGHTAVEVHVYAPETFSTMRESTGAIASIASDAGERIDVIYDPASAPATIPGDPAVKGYAITGLHLHVRDPGNPLQMMDRTVTAPGFVLVGVPSGAGKPAGTGVFAGLAARYASAARLAKQLGTRASQDALDSAALAETLRVPTAGDAAQAELLSLPQRAFEAAYAGSTPSSARARAAIKSFPRYSGGYAKAGRNGFQNLGVDDASGDAGEDFSIVELEIKALKAVEFVETVGEFFGDEVAEVANAVSKWTSELMGVPTLPTSPIGGVTKLLESDLKLATHIHENLRQDPPRTDYTVIALPQPPSVPTVTPDEAINAARVATLTSLLGHHAQYLGAAVAAGITMDRLAGARLAGDATWSAKQLRALLELKREMAVAALAYATDLDAICDEIDQDGTADVSVQASDLQKYQADLRQQGRFSTAAVAAAKARGLDDATIARWYQELLALTPDDLPTSYKGALRDLAGAMRGYAARWSLLPAVDLHML